MPPFDFVGPYELGEKLGQGGMGSVFRATHAKSKEKVAVKIIAAQVADEPRFRRRFDAEIKTLMSLQHPGIVKLIGFGEEHGQLFYSMELVEGESLQARIKREKKIAWRQCIDTAIEICTALKHAHDVGVIHRDLKPANLLINSDQNVKLVDFGIAKIFGDGQQTVVGSMLGTLDYMAPEQVDSSSITVRTDLYAVGSVMYAMLTGRPPFRGKNATQVLDMLKNQPPARLDLIDPDLPEPLIELVHELLEKEASNRPPTALSVAKRLKAMRAGLEKLETMRSDQTNALEELNQMPTSVGASHETEATMPPQNMPDGQQASTGTSPDTELTKNSLDSVTRFSGDSTLLGQSEIKEGRTRAEAGKTAESIDRSRTQVAQTVVTASSSQDSFELAPELETHFQEAEVARQSARLQKEEADTPRQFGQRMTILAMSSVLILGAGLFFYASKPPTADELYQQAIGENGSSAQRAFIKKFPEDLRRIEVEDRLMLGNLEAAVKRIGTQEVIGVKELAAAEISFLNIFGPGENGSNEQQAMRLQDWLSAFGRTSSDQEQQVLIELVRYELERLNSGRVDPRVDPQLRDLLADIEGVCKINDLEERRERLQAIINLFQDQVWAGPAIEAAAKHLKEITDPNQAVE